MAEDAFAVARTEGLALSLEEALDYASRGRGERNRPKHGWGSLTPTELEVVRHVAAGLTNPQIGERIFVSRATVKVRRSSKIPAVPSQTPPIPRGGSPTDDVCEGTA